MYNRYSCPYQYAKKKVDLRVTDTKVEIYSGSNRIATHNRFPAGRKNQYSTHPEDMEELGEQVLGKLQSMTDEEFAEISLEAAE